MDCPVCSRPVNGHNRPRPDFGWDAHEYLVKRHSIPKKHQHRIFVVENIVPVHHVPCHMAAGQERGIRERCLRYAIDHLGAERIARWYIRLQIEFDLPTGTIPLYEQGRFTEYLLSLLTAQP